MDSRPKVIGPCVHAEKMGRAQFFSLPLTITRLFYQLLQKNNIIVKQLAKIFFLDTSIYFKLEVDYIYGDVYNFQKLFSWFSTFCMLNEFLHAYRNEFQIELCVPWKGYKKLHKNYI